MIAWWRLVYSRRSWQCAWKRYAWRLMGGKAWRIARGCLAAAAGLAAHRVAGKILGNVPDLHSKHIYGLWKTHPFSLLFAAVVFFHHILQLFMWQCKKIYCRWCPHISAASRALMMASSVDSTVALNKGSILHFGITFHVSSVDLLLYCAWLCWGQENITLAVVGRCRCGRYPCSLRFLAKSSAGCA